MSISRLVLLFISVAAKLPVPAHLILTLVQAKNHVSAFKAPVVVKLMVQP